MSINTHQCRKCRLSTISDEEHECPLADVRYVGHSLIGGSWYINTVSKNGIDWMTIKPIPIPPDEGLQVDKKDRTDGDLTEPDSRYCKLSV